jgi:uncharacterized protein
MDANDADHDACAALFAETDEQLVVPAPVLVELDWLGALRGVPARDVALQSVLEGSILVEDLSIEDYERIADLCERYRDLQLGLVDAAVVAVAERLREREVATLDHRHFSVVRPRHVKAFALLP